VRKYLSHFRFRRTEPCCCLALRVWILKLNTLKPQIYGNNETNIYIQADWLKENTCLLFSSFDIYTLIHPVVCLTTSSHPLPKRVLHTVRSNASFFQFTVSSLFLTRYLAAAYVFFFVFPSLILFPSILPSTTCFSRQFVHKMCPIQLAFLILVRFVSQNCE
jgi:hypothetical protein